MFGQLKFQNSILTYGLENSTADSLIDLVITEHKGFSKHSNNVVG